MISPLEHACIVPVTTCEIIGALPPYVEEPPVTMQIGIRANDHSIVLASDRMWRVQEKTYGSEDPIIEPQFRSKIAFSQRHQLAIALAGGGSLDTNPTKELAEFLSAQDVIPDNLEPLLTKWGDDLFAKEYPEHADRKLCFARQIYSILVVNPNTEFQCFWKLFVNRKSRCRDSSRYMVSGDDTNWAVFWPQYLRAGSGELKIGEATGVAAATILMGHVLNPSGVDDLEIWQYDKSWNGFHPDKIAAIKQRFAGFQERTKRSVLDISIGA